MAFRCSSSMGLAVLVGGGGCLLLASPAQAGDRIEFSAPAIPLSVPRQDVEIKDQQSVSFQGNIGAGLANEPGLSPVSVIIISSPKAKAGNSWDSDASGNDGRDESDARNWLSSPAGLSRLTNGWNMRRGWDSSQATDGQDEHRFDRALDGSQDARRFGAQSDSERASTQNESQFGRGLFNNGDSSLWSRGFSGHELSALGRFGSGEFAPAMGGAAASGVVASLANNTRAAADPWRGMTGLPGLDRYSTPEEAGRRQAGEETGVSFGEMRAWDRPALGRHESRRYIPSDQTGPAPVVAPNNPVDLPMPKRPGDPF